MDPWRPYEERQTERNMEEDSVERDEGERLDKGHLEWQAPDRNQWQALAEALCVLKHEED